MPISTAGLSVIDPQRVYQLERRQTQRSYYHQFKVPEVEFSLGWELEANISASRVPGGVLEHSDGSVNDEAKEYVVMPTLVQSPTYVLGLLKQLVHAPRLNTDSSCGFHIHLSPKGKTKKVMRQWAVMLQILGRKIEEQAFAAVPESRQNNRYTKKIRFMRNGERFSGVKYNNNYRYQWVNIVEMFRPGGIQTVEIRLLGHTHRWKYLLAWSLFCLELADEAWKCLYDPFQQEYAIRRLTNLLKLIETEIKPLEKRKDLISETIYANLKSLGIDSQKWDRPLAKLTAKEAEIRGLKKQWYSDAQLTAEPENEPCVHGYDRDVDCCYECDHDEGNCGGSRNGCAYCEEGN